MGVTLSPPSIVRYVTKRKLACRACARTRHEPRGRARSIIRSQDEPRTPVRFHLSQSSPWRLSLGRRRRLRGALGAASTASSDCRDRRTRHLGNRRPRLRPPTRRRSHRRRAESACSLPAVIWFAPKKEGRRSGPKSREETPTWAATEKTRRGTGSRQTVRPASTTFKFQDPLTREPRCSFPPRLAPVESTFMTYPGHRIMEMLSRGISTRRPTLNSVFLITLGFQFFRVSAVGCNASVIALTVAPARQQRSCDHR